MGFFDNIKDASTHSTASNATEFTLCSPSSDLKREIFWYRLRKLD